MLAWTDTHSDILDPRSSDEPFLVALCAAHRTPDNARTEDTPAT